jgi:hypothetical protein
MQVAGGTVKNLISDCEYSAILSLVLSQRSQTQHLVLKKAWMTKESVITIKVLRHCFAKLSNAIGYVNNTFDQFWLLDTLQITVSVVSSIAQIALSPDKFIERTSTQIVLVSITVMRLLLLAMFCGDVSDEVNLKLGECRVHCNTNMIHFFERLTR